MNTYKEGDRVSHPTYGHGTVVTPRYGTGWPTVQFDNGEKIMTSEFTLSPAPTGKFKLGDRVSHPLHRDGTVEEINLSSGLHIVNIGGNRVYMALEHQITPAVPEPTYHICIEEITGAAHVPGNLTAKEVANYIEHAVNWRVVQEIKITKEGN